MLSFIARKNESTGQRVLLSVMDIPIMTRSVKTWISIIKKIVPIVWLVIMMEEVLLIYGLFVR